MKWRILIGLPVPKELELSKKDRTAIYREALRLPRARWRLIISYLLPSMLIAFVLNGFALMLAVSESVTNIRAVLLILIGGSVVSMLIIYIAIGITNVRVYRPLIYRVLRKRGYVICTKCDYVIGMTRNRAEHSPPVTCPECGTHHESLSNPS